MNEAIIRRDAELHVRRWYWSDKSFVAHKVRAFSRDHPKSAMLGGLFPSLFAGMLVFTSMFTQIDYLMGTGNGVFNAGDMLAAAVFLMCFPLFFVFIPVVLTDDVDDIPEDMYVDLVEKTEKWLETSSAMCPFSVTDHVAYKFSALRRVHGFSDGYREYRANGDVLRQMTATMRRHYHALNAAVHVSGDVLELVPAQVVEESSREFQSLSTIADGNMVVLDTLSKHTLMNRELDIANKLR
jgi:hypothetical protein